MAAAFGRSTQTRVPYRRRWRPDAAAVEREIVDEWHVLCARQERGDDFGAGLSTTRLHDLGVHLYRARRRQPLLPLERQHA